MSDFEKWWEDEKLEWSADAYKLSFVELGRIAYEAGFRAASDKAATLPQRVMFDAGYERGRKAGLEEAHIIATMQIAAKSDSPCSDICTEIEERMK